MKILAAVLFLLSTAVCSYSQSAKDFNEKYPLFTAYELRPGIIMTPKYDDKGEVCEMTIQKRRTSGRVTDIDSFLSEELQQEIVNEVAPPKVRGKELTDGDSWFGTVLVVGQMRILRRKYENILVEAIGTASSPGPEGDVALIITWQNRTCVQPDRNTKN